MKPLIFTEQYHSGILSFFYDDEGFLIFRAKQEWIMMLDQCSHLKIPLSTGWIEDDCVVCPWHQWKFNKLGHCTWPPPAHQERVPVYTVRERDGIIWLVCETDNTYWESIVVEKHWREVQSHIQQESSHWVGVKDSTIVWFGGAREEVEKMKGSFEGSIFSTE